MATSGVLLAVGASLIYNLAVVVQKVEAQRSGAGGIRIIAALARRPIWLLGIALQVGGFGLHVVALTLSPVTVVQTVVGAGIVFVVLFSWIVLREVPGRREVVGIVTAVGGVVMLVLTVGPDATIEPVTWAGLVLTVSVLAFAVGAAGYLWRSRRGNGATGVLAGLTAGVAAGGSDTMNRLMGAWLSPGDGWQPPAAMGVTAAVLLFAFGFVGFVAIQNGLKRFRANLVVPSMQVPNVLVPIGAATFLYGQSVPAGLAATAVRLIAVGLVVAGVAILASSERVAAAYVDETEPEPVGGRSSAMSRQVPPSAS